MRKQWEASLDGSEHAPRAFTLCSASGWALLVVPEEVRLVWSFPITAALGKWNPDRERKMTEANA